MPVSGWSAIRALADADSAAIKTASLINLTTMKSLSTALLILSCCVWLAMGADSSQQLTDMDKLSSVGTVRFKGSSLRVFQVDGAQVAEPTFAFQSSCRPLKFSRVYMKYQLALPLRIYANTLRSGRRSWKNIGRVTITDLKVEVHKGLLRDRALTVMVKLSRSGRAADLLFLCSSLRRCHYLQDGIVSNPRDIGRAVKFQAVGTVGHRPVRFGARRSANSPSLSCSRHRWVVFHRRVDGSLSFAQNWDAYVKGFGNPKSNYWMGLDRLSKMTKTAKQNSSQCRLRIETVDFRDKKYTAEFAMFQVLGPENNYRLRVGKQVGSSELGKRFLYNKDMQFSTYDRDHDKWRFSCSKSHGNAGWWYNYCSYIHLTGLYSTDVRIHKRSEVRWNHTVLLGNKFVLMKRSLMKFKCH